MQPLELVTGALVPATVRNQREQGLDQMPTHGRRDRRIIVGKAISVVAVVASEQLVAAVATKYHLDLLASHLRDHVHTNGQRIGRFVELADESRQGGEQGWADLLLVVPRAITFRHQSCRRRLIELTIRQTHGERLEIIGQAMMHQQRHDERRVQATAHEGTDRHIADQVQSDAVDQTLLQLGQQILLAAR